MATDLKSRKAVTPPVATIRAFREFAGLSLDDVARRITDEGYPISKAGLGNIETGTRGPSQEFLEAWQRAFDTLARTLHAGKVTEQPRVIDRVARAAATRAA
jgi:transcriptional regulator with XRE-family HTH domain